MTYPFFVDIYNADLDVTKRVSEAAVDDYEAKGWTRVVPGDTPAADPFLTQTLGDARYEALIDRDVATAGQVPVLQADGTLAFEETEFSGDTATAALIGNPASDTAGALAAATGTGLSVEPYGAVADGVTDDTAAIADAIAAAASIAAVTGRSVPVRLMAGTHLVSMQPQPVNGTILAAIQLPSNVHLIGMGRGATVVKLAGSEPDAGHIIQNTGLDGGDHDITVSDLTVDGNGANNTELSQGLSFLRASDLAVTRVTVTNVHGTDPFPPGETFHFNFNQCARVQVTDCIAIGSAGTQGSGFGDNSSTNISYTGCHSIGMSEGMGFASWHGANIAFGQCLAQQCGTNGFNIEFGADVTLAACIAGGAASDQADGYTYTDSEDLGNGGSGFVVNGTARAVLTGCISRGNDTGLSVVSAGAVTSSAQVIGGHFSDNTAVGIYFGDATCAQQSRVSSQTEVTGNATTNWTVNGGVGFFGSNASGAVPAPAQATGAVVTNPYPFTVTVYLDGTNIFFVMVGGVNIGVLHTLTVPAGGTVQVNYGTAPTRTWFRT